MAVYTLSLGENLAKEFYSLAEFKNAFKKDRHLFEFLELEELLYFYKKNNKSMIWGTVYPLKDGYVKFVEDRKLLMVNGCYGN
jgi:hypothetical protein